MGHHDASRDALSPRGFVLSRPRRPAGIIQRDVVVAHRRQVDRIAHVVAMPHGVPTRPEVDPKRNGTKPVEFERDRKKVVELILRFVLPETRCVRHPGFGVTTRDE